MRVCSAVFHCTPKISKPMPEMNAAPAIAATGAGADQEQRDQRAGQAAERGHQHRPLEADAQRDHAAGDQPDSLRGRDRAPRVAAPPSEVLATTGPTTAQAPNQPISITVNCSTIVHSQVCDDELAKAVDQVAQQARALAARLRRAGGSWRRAAALARKVAASMASAEPAPAVAATTPPAAAPSAIAVACAIESSAFAACRRSRGTTSGTRPTPAGKCSAKAIPQNTFSASATGTLAQPRQHQRRERALRGRGQEVGAHHLALARAAVGQRAREELHGDLRAAAQREHEPDVARRRRCRSSSTAKGRAIGVIALPNAVTSRAANSRAKSGSREQGESVAPAGLSHVG